MSYLYCQNTDCGEYLGSLGGKWCPHCGWTEPVCDKDPQTPPPRLSNGEFYTLYIEVANQTLRPQDERIALGFARAIESAVRKQFGVNDE